MMFDRSRNEDAPPLPACGERVGVRGSLKGLNLRRIPLTRIASNDAIRPLPAGGER